MNQKPPQPGPEFTKSRSLSFAAVGIMVVLVFAVLIAFQRFLVMPKLLVVMLILLVAILTGKFRLLVRDWYAFFAFIYLFDSLRGTIYILTCKLQLPVYATYALNLEKKLFGTVPPVALQHALLRPDEAGNFSWVEKILTVFYGSHFVGFLLVGFLIWLYKPDLFSRFKTSFYLLTGLGIFFYAVVPTVPPWMAAEQFGLLPPLTRFNAILFNFAIPDLSNGFDTNPIAAMPSLHAAFPILCSLLLWGIYRWRSWPFHLYTLVVLFTIIYTGDHYVVDALAGLVLAVACYYIARRFVRGKRVFEPQEGLPPPTVRAPDSPALLRKQFLKGLGILAIGVIIGSVNKTQFLLHVNDYGLHSPRYVDFFGTGDRYRDNFKVQFYLGDHYLGRREYKSALAYLERSLALATDPVDKNEVQMRLGLCRRILGLKN